MSYHLREDNYFISTRKFSENSKRLNNSLMCAMEKKRQYQPSLDLLASLLFSPIGAIALISFSMWPFLYTDVYVAGNTDFLSIFPLVGVTICGILFVGMIIGFIVEYIYNCYMNNKISKDIQQLKMKLDSEKETTLKWEKIQKHLRLKKKNLSMNESSSFSCSVFFLLIAVGDYFFGKNLTFLPPRVIRIPFWLMMLTVSFGSSRLQRSRIAAIDEKMTAAGSEDKNKFLELEYGKDWNSLASNSNTKKHVKTRNGTEVTI